MTTYFMTNDDNEVTLKLTRPRDDGDIPSLIKLGAGDCNLGDIYDPETQTFSANPKTAINARIFAIDEQIKTIEASQTRQLREIVRGADDGTARAKLDASDAEITTLRIERASLVSSLA